jgi:hypothetical protein
MTYRIAPGLAQFIARHLGSVEELHVLIACMRERDRWWDSRSIGADLGMSESSALRAFEQLARHNLLDVRVSGDVRYRFAPATPEVEQEALAFGAAYWENPLAVTQHVASVARGAIGDFADAFRIRRNEHS